MSSNIEIKPTNAATSTSVGKENKVTAKQPEAKATQIPVPADSVSITPQAKDLQQVQQQLAHIPEINATKAAAIKTAIQDGSYIINPEKLAESMLTLEAELNDLFKA